MTLFEAITWKQYLSVIAIGLVLYYAFIFFRYKRGSISRTLIRNKKSNQENDRLFNPDDEEDEPDTVQSSPSQHNVHSFDELERLVEEIRYSILEKAGKNISKDQLLAQLSERLINYGGLRQPAYRIALTNFIIEQSENICGVAFSEEELEEAWEKLPR